jgi:hypothetical protein
VLQTLCEQEDTALQARGMRRSEILEALAAQLPDGSIRFNSAVSSVTADGAGTDAGLKASVARQSVVGQQGSCSCWLPGCYMFLILLGLLRSTMSAGVRRQET